MSLKKLLALLALASCLQTTGAAADDAKSKPDLSLKAEADFLALRVTAEVPKNATAIAYRLSEMGGVPDRAEWSVVATAPGEDGQVKFEVPLPNSRWAELQLRAMKGDEVIAKRETRPKPRHFEMLTPGRIAALPQAERDAWTTYMGRSEERFAAEFDTLAAECRMLRLAQAAPAPGNGKELEMDGNTTEAWFAGDDAKRLADAVISYQTPSGGWSKAVNYARGPRPPGTHWISQDGEGGWHYCGTLDNRSTTEQIKLLAGVFTATQRVDAKAAALRGIEWLLEAQFPNGGWPQNYPAEPGYHEAITLNDNAVTHALEVLLAISGGKAPFIFADQPLRQRARRALEKGIACMAAAQVRVEDQLTVWCAQHDPLTLAPVAARKKEPPSLSGGESAELLKFFMRQGPATPEVIAMVEPALKWLDAHRISGLRKTKTAAGKTDYIADASSTDIYWARFYDIQTGKPMFAGAQDGIVYPTFTEMAAKNKVAYDYFTTRPRDLLEKEVPRWKKRLAKGITPEQ